VKRGEKKEEGKEKIKEKSSHRRGVSWQMTLENYDDLRRRGASALRKEKLRKRVD